MPAHDVSDPPENPPQTGPVRNLRLIWLGTALSILLGSILLLEPFTPEVEPPVSTSKAETSPDLLLSDAVITSFRNDGSLKYLLRSPRIEHFEGDDRTYLSNPDLELHSDPDPPWHMTARKGTISNASSKTGKGKLEEQVLLDEDVRMAQIFADGRSFELRTPSIILYPDREYAETTQDVMITTHVGRTTAVGLQGDLDQGLLQLFSDEEQRVHTVLLPDQFK